MMFVVSLGMDQRLLLGRSWSQASFLPRLMESSVGRLSCWQLRAAPPLFVQPSRYFLFSADVIFSRPEATIFSFQDVWIPNPPPPSQLTFRSEIKAMPLPLMFASEDIRLKKKKKNKKKKVDLKERFMPII